MELFDNIQACKSNKNVSKKTLVRSILIRGDLGVITKSIKSFDNILTSVRHVAICIPQFTCHDQAEFWKETVILNLNSILAQEAQTRQTIRRCFSIICNLTENVLKLPKLFKAERVQFAQKRFPNAFSKLIDNISALENLEFNAIDQFEKRTQTIFHLPGAGALDVLDQIKLVEAQLKKCNREKDIILAEHENRKVNMKNLKPLMEDQEKLIQTKQLEMYDLNLSLAKLQQMAAQLKLVIHGSKRAKNTPRTTYHQYLLKSKLQCLQKYAEIKNEKQNELELLVTTLFEHTAKYECEKTLLKYLEANSVTMNHLENKLDKLREDVSKIDTQKHLFAKHQEKLGIEGDQYVKFLVYLRQLAMAIKYGCDSYAPIISVLNEIKWLIQCPIALIESEEESDVLLAERLLLKNAKFLWSYCRSVRLCMTNYHHKRGWLLEP